MRHGYGRGWLEGQSTLEAEIRKCKWHLVIPELNAISGVISCPFSSRAFEMDSVAEANAMAIQRLASPT